MSSRPLFKPHSVITDGDMSGDLTSEVTIIQMLSMASYSVKWVGTAPVGVITVEVSNDYSQNSDGSVRNAGTWNTLVLTQTCAVIGNADNGYIDIESHAGYAIRLKYTRTSGTGTMNVVISGKVM